MSQQNETQTPSQLMSKPALSFDEFCEVLDLPKSTLEEITRVGDGPSFFLIGRRRYVRRQDMLDWIDKQAEQKPYFPRRHNRRSGATT